MLLSSTCSTGSRRVKSPFLPACLCAAVGEALLLLPPVLRPYPGYFMLLLAVGLDRLQPLRPAAVWPWPAISPDAALAAAVTAAFALRTALPPGSQWGHTTSASAASCAARSALLVASLAC
jgi:hypothetical protein